MSGIDNAVPGLRSQALSQYQNQQNSLLTALSGMANTEALDRSAYGANFANYENQQAFLANQSQQARNENDNYWNNLWNQIKNVGNIAKTAYDGYMGYTYQQELLEMQKQQQKLQDAQTLNNLFAVNPDMARQIAQEDGYDSSIFDNYSVDGPVTRAEKANAYLNGTQLLGSGYVDAAGNYASLFGVDPSSLGSYTDAANLAFDDWARRQMFTKSLSGTSGSSGRSSGSSGSSGKSGSGWTNSELRNLMKDRNEVAAKGGDTSWYDNILAEAGYPVDSGQTSTKSTGKSAYNGNNPSTGGLLALSGSAGKYGSNQTAVGKDTNNILTANLKNSAVTAAKAMQTKGKKEQEIYNDLRKQGYTDNQILYALNQLS